MSRKQPQTIETLAMKMHRSRETVRKLRRAMALHYCDFERAADMAVEAKIQQVLSDAPDSELRPDPTETERQPCWKGADFRDIYPGGGRGGERPGGWCKPCIARQGLYAVMRAERARLSGLTTAFWRAAKRLHDSTEREERR